MDNTDRTASRSAGAGTTNIKARNDAGVMMAVPFTAPIFISALDRAVAQLARVSPPMTMISSELDKSTARLASMLGRSPLTVDFVRPPEFEASLFSGEAQ